MLVVVVGMLCRCVLHWLSSW